jgi:transposase-like protein
MAMTRAEWEELVAEWRVSGQSARQFAKAHGIADTALRYWANRAGDDEQGGRGGGAKGRGAARPRKLTSSAPAVAPMLAQVVRPGETPTGADGRVTLTVGKATIAVEPGFDEGHLRAVVRALSEVG